MQPELLTNKHWEENTYSHVRITEKEKINVTPLQTELLTTPSNIILHCSNMKRLVVRSKRVR